MEAAHFFPRPAGGVDMVLGDRVASRFPGAAFDLKHDHAANEVGDFGNPLRGGSIPLHLLFLLGRALAPFTVLFLD